MPDGLGKYDRKRAEETVLPAGWAWQRPARTLRWRLSFLVAVGLAPLLVLVLVMVYLDFRADRERSSQQMEAVARGMALAVERELRSTVAGLEVLSLSPVLARRDFAAFRHEAEALLRQHYPGGSVALLMPNGDQVFNTARPAGAVLPRPPNLEALHRVIATGRPAVSDVFVAVLQGKPIVPIQVPVFDEDGRVWAVLSLAPDLSTFAGVIREQRPHPEWIVAIVDRRGTIVARSVNPELFVGKPAQALLRGLMAERAEGTAAALSLEGQQVLTSWSRPAESGWGVAIGIPSALIIAPLWQALGTTLSLSALVLAGALALARLEAGRIARPVNALVRLAAQGTAAEALHRSLGLREADAVATALAGAQRERVAAEARLQRIEAESRAELERLVEVRTEALEAAQAQLLQSQRLEAVGQLTAGVAHDFNNLLQAQSGGLELLLRSVKGQPKAERLVERALAMGVRGARLTHSLLAFSRKQLLRPEVVAVGSTLTVLQEMLSRTLDPRVSLTFSIDDKVGAVLADPTQLESALLNLCLNARDAMPEGGRLLVEARRGGAVGDAPAGLAAQACLVLSVTDEGYGMDAATLARACEPFFTTKEVGKGSGLGLAMVQGFARQSGGELKVHSRIGAGTRVELWLPRAEAAAAPNRPQPEVGTGKASGRVLLVEDESEVRELITDVVEEAGFDVVAVGSAVEAAALLQAREHFDVLVTDYAMPGMTGGELMQVARGIDPDMPVLLVTGYVDASQMGGVPAGVKTLHKPFRVEELVRRLVVMAGRE